MVFGDWDRGVIQGLESKVIGNMWDFGGIIL